MNLLTGCLLAIIVLLIIVSIVAFRSASGNAVVIQEYFSKKMKVLDENVRKQLAEHLKQQTIKDNELYQNINSCLRDDRKSRDESLDAFSESFDKRLGAMQKASAESSAHLVNTLEGKLREMREAQERRLINIQEVVDERLIESFGSISKSLSDLQVLLDTVQDLKKSLSAVQESDETTETNGEQE